MTLIKRSVHDLVIDRGPHTAGINSMSHPSTAQLAELDWATDEFDTPRMDIPAILELALIELIASGRLDRDCAIAAVEDAATTLQFRMPLSEQVSLAVVTGSLRATRANGDSAKVK